MKSHPAIDLLAASLARRPIPFKDVSGLTTYETGQIRYPYIRRGAFGERSGVANDESLCSRRWQNRLRLANNGHRAMNGKPVNSQRAEAA